MTGISWKNTTASSHKGYPASRGRNRSLARAVERAVVKVVFWTYLIVIASGLAYFSVIGLTHH